MKKVLTFSVMILGVATAVYASVCTAGAPIRITFANSTPVQVISTRTPASEYTVLASTANVGDVYVRNDNNATVNSTTYSYYLHADDTQTEAKASNEYDLSHVYVTGTANDTVTITYRRPGF